MKLKDILVTVGLCVMAVAIPGLLVVDAVQARKYTQLQKEVAELEEKQEQLVMANSQLITDISILSSSDRIEKIAQEELGMRPAESDEILRVDVSRKQVVGEESPVPEENASGSQE